MSLIQSLTYREYHRALSFTRSQCETIAKLARLSSSYENVQKPGEQMMKDLDRRGFSADQYRHLVKTSFTIYKPQAKIAILLGNSNYTYLPKLATPSKDCDDLAKHLKRLGFIIVVIENVLMSTFKQLLGRIANIIPEDSYCFLFYAGHGFELCNIKYILGIDSPNQNIQMEHGVTENFILKNILSRKPELCVLVMDMCRVYLDRKFNPNLYNTVPYIEEYVVDRNLIIGYSTQSAMSAYEEIQLECSQTIGNITYQLKSEDLEHIVPRTSQYVKALCRHIGDKLDVSSMIDRVHEDLENAAKKQIPIKLVSGVTKRSLHDPVSGNHADLLTKIKDLVESYDFKTHCKLL